MLFYRSTSQHTGSGRLVNEARTVPVSVTRSEQPSTASMMRRLVLRLAVGLPVLLWLATPLNAWASVDAQGASGSSVPTDTLAATGNGGSFGVSPNVLSFPGLARGASGVSDVIIVNSTEADAAFVVTSSGDTAKWTLFGPQNQAVPNYEFDAPPGVSTVRVALSVPADAPNGEYTGKVKVISQPTEDAGTAGVSVAFEVNVEATVSGDQRLEANYSNFAVLASEVGKPVELRATVANTGNVAILVTTQIDIRRNATVVEQLDTLESPQTIDPGRSGDIVLDWDTKDTLPGDYTVEMKLLSEGLELGTKSSNFRLEAPGTFQPSVALADVSIDTAKTPPLLTGAITNTGQIAGRTMLRVAVKRGDEVIEQFESESTYIAPSDRVTREVPLAVSAPGTYSVETIAVFDGYETAPVVTKLSIGEAGDSSFPVWLPVAGIAALVGLGAVAIRRRGRAKARSAASRQQAAALRNRPTPRPTSRTASSTEDDLDDAADLPYGSSNNGHRPNERVDR
jgi:hypothetical protein